MQRLQGALGPLAPEPHHVGLFQTEDFNCGHASREKTDSSETSPIKIISKTATVEDGAAGYDGHSIKMKPQSTAVGKEDFSWTLAARFSE
jgi:hypothetical protein